jgi:hypothetical protein
MEDADRKAVEQRMLADELGYAGEERKEFVHQTETDAIITRGFYRVFVDRRDQGTRLRNLALFALPAVPVGAPILWLIYLWVAAGFRKAAD